MSYCSEVACYHFEPCITHQSANILDFWFGKDPYEYRSGLWWKGIQRGTVKSDTPEDAQRRTDVYVREQFGWLLEELLAGDERMKEWGGESDISSTSTISTTTPQERVAFMILCDQLAKNAYRDHNAIDDKRNMSAFDAYAQKAATQLVSSADFKDLPWNHRLFCYITLLRGEDVSIAEKTLLGVRVLGAELEGKLETKEISNHLKKLISSFQSYVKVLMKFGRYPHKNAALDRVSTPEENAWLKSEKLPMWAHSTNSFTQKDNSKKKRSNKTTTTSASTTLASPITPAVSAPQKSFRILVLHGNRSNLGRFRSKTKVPFAALTAQGHVLHYVNAPHIYIRDSSGDEDKDNGKKPDHVNHNNNNAGASDQEPQQQINRCWWNASDDPSTMIYRGLTESIEFFEKFFEHEGPFDGILGFSQGATMGAILAALQHEKLTKFIRFKFFIDISGFYCRDTRPEYNSLHVIKKSTPNQGADEIDVEPRLPLIPLPSFHTWGLQDKEIESWRTEMLSKCFENASTLTHPAGHFTSALNQWPIKEISEWIKNLHLEPATRGFQIKKSFKETVLMISNCRRDEYASFANNQQEQIFSDLPVSLTFPSIALDEFWLNKGQVLLTNGDVKQKDCELFVARAFALDSSSATATATAASSSSSSLQQHLDIIDDLLLLGWAIFPFKIPAKNKVYSQGEVFFWLFHQTHLQANSEGRRHIVSSRLPLLAEYGNWAAPVRLALLDATGSSLRQGTDANETKENEEANVVTGKEQEKQQETVAAVEKEKETDVGEQQKTEGTIVANDGDGVENHYATISKVSEFNRAIAELFTRQLLLDYESVTRLGEDIFNVRDLDYDARVIKRLDLVSKGGSFPSSCAVHAPRMQTYVSRTTHLPQAISAMLMLHFEEKQQQQQQQENINKKEMLPKFANVLYKNILAQISICLKQLSKDNLSRMRAPDLSWYSLSEEGWEKLKKSALSSSVIHPSPEPVDVSSREQLEPLYNFLKSGKDLFQMKPRINKGVQELSFERGTICSDGRLDLCKQVIGPSGVEDLMKTLRADSEKQHALVKHILLGNNVAGDSLASGIAQFISSKQSKLTTWYIAGNRLTGDGLLPLTEALADDKQVLQLWLKRNPLSLRGAEVLSTLLTRNHHLQVLDLTTTGLLDEGITTLMNGLQANRGLEYLYLDGNGITPVGLHSVKNYLLSHKGCLKGLSLGCNRVGDEGAQIVCEGLVNHPSIVRFVLPSCGLGPKAAEAIANMLKSNDKLLYLDLGFQNMTAALREVPNRIGSEGAKFLADALRVNRTLKYLDISQNQITQEGILALQQVIRISNEDDDNNQEAGSEIKEDVGVKRKQKVVDGLIELKMQQFGVPLSELTLEQIRLHVKNNRRLSTPFSPEIEEAIRPAHLEEIASVYRVGQVYKEEKASNALSPKMNKV